MKTFNIQEHFLSQLKKSKTTITVFLISGYQIRGTVKFFDNYTIVIDSDGNQQMIFKHAISTIIPSRSVNFHYDDQEQE